MTAPDLLDRGPLHVTQDEIVAALKRVFPVTLFSHRIMPPRLTKGVWDAMARTLPFVGVGWTGWKTVQGSGAALQGDAGFAVFLVVDGKNVEAALTGGRGPNLFGMVNAAALALNGLRIGKGADTIGTLLVRDSAPMFDESWDDGSRIMAGLTLSINTGLLGDESQVAALEDMKGVEMDFSGWLPGLTGD